MKVIPECARMDNILVTAIDKSIYVRLRYESMIR